ncbi:hypothetical protein [Bifidobacterium aquikefiricola]|uniref:Uncharacterized protein n=1 Tax=Bifidobacterium aquikefiricola TaxID=3059038 RepID=A0AB39U688_9BIFI
MTNTFYDDFKSMTAEKIAGSMEDMTYVYKQTRVPKAHYRKMLSTGVEQVMEASVEINLIQPYISIIKQMMNENPKSFYKALLCIDAKVTITNIRTSEWEALEDMWQAHQSKDDPNHGGHLPKQTIDTFKDIAKHGLDRLGNELDDEQE